MILAALLLQAAAPAPAAPAVPWVVTTKAGAAGSATTSSAWSTDNTARLVVRCDVTAEKIVSIQFIPRTGFAPALPRPVSINVDDGGWFGANWQFPGTGAFISDDVIVTNLVVMLAQGKSIRVRAIDPDNKPVEAVFTAPGQAPIRRILAACGYDFGKTPPRSAATVPRVAPDPAAAAKAQPDPDAD